MKSLREFLKVDLWFAVFIVTPSVLVCILTPPNMDEFLHYSTISCLFYPNATAHVFREACGLYDLSILGVNLPLRPFGYTGSSASLLYFPVFLIFPHYFSARLIGFLSSLVIFLVGRATIDAPRWLLAAVIFWFFPLVFMTIVDTGPVSLQLALSVLIPYLFVKLKSVQAAFSLGIMLFFAFWNKFIFVVCAPSMLFFIIYFARVTKTSFQDLILRRKKFIAIFSLTFANLTFLLLSATDSSGATFYEILSGMGQNISILNGREQLRHLMQIKMYFTNFQNFGHRIFPIELGFGSANFIATTVIWCEIVAVTIYLIVRKSLRFIVLGFFLSCAGCFFWLNLISAVQSGHHVIFAYIPLLFGLAVLLGRLYERHKKLAIAVAAIFVVSNGIIFSSVLFKKPYDESSWDRVELLRVLKSKDLATKYAYVVVDWGFYYYAALYGDRSQLVLYEQPFNLVSDTKAIVASKNRKALFVKRIFSPSDAVINYNYKIAKKIQLGTSREPPKWELWLED